MARKTKQTKKTPLHESKEEEDLERFFNWTQMGEHFGWPKGHAMKLYLKAVRARKIIGSPTTYDGSVWVQGKFIKQVFPGGWAIRQKFS